MSPFRGPARRLRSWLVGPLARQVDDLRRENRALQRQLDELTGVLGEGLSTLGRTGRELRRLSEQLGPQAASTEDPARTGVSATPSVSVVIATYNRAESLREVLLLLKAQDHPEFEVVVVNGPSTDPTASLLADWADRVKVTTCDRTNIAASRNIGIAAAAGDIVAFLDDDTYPESEWLGELVAAFVDPSTVGVGGPVLDRTGGRVEQRHRVGTRLGETRLLSDLASTDVNGSPYGAWFPILPGGNSAYRREALLAIGGFDEAFEYGGEEGDVDLRLVEAAHLLREAPDALVVHQVLANEDRRADLVMLSRYRYLRSKAYFARKHGSRYFPEREIAASDERVVAGFRAERARAVSTGLLEASYGDAFEEEAGRALEDGAAMWREHGSQHREASWFASLALPFKPFPHLDRSAGKRHQVLVAVDASRVPDHVLVRAEAAAAQGHVVRLVTTVAGPGRIAAVNGVWRHELSVVGAPATEAVAAQVAEAVREIDRRRRATSLEVFDVPAAWIERLVAAGLTPAGSAGGQAAAASPA